MALPTLPNNYRQQAYDGLTAYLPGKWFQQLASKESPLYPLLWGVALAIAYLRLSVEGAIASAIPLKSSGIWLTLHLLGIGLTRGASETDDKAKERYFWEFRQTRNTRKGQLDYLKWKTGLDAPQLRLEGDRSIGRFGYLRVVVNAVAQPWSELDLSWVGEFVRRLVTNGVVPSVNLKLQCLLFQSFPAWQFSHPFPMSYTVQGFLWERPAFISAERLYFAQNLVAQVSAAEWRVERDRLTQLYRDGRQNGPGALFLYLSDQGQCPFMTVNYDLNLTSTDIGDTFPDRGWKVDGWHFYDGFGAIGPSQDVELLAPFLAEAPFLEAPPFEPVNVPSLSDLEDFPGTSAGGGGAVLQYRGLDFTRRQILEFTDSPAPITDPGYTSPELELMKSGPWKLRLSEGLLSWGAFPPSGTTFTGAELAELNPSSIWWTDETGTERSHTPLWDGTSVYLAIEFLLPAGDELVLKELELTLDGDRVNYRRFNLPISEEINCGFAFLVRGTNL